MSKEFQLDDRLVDNKPIRSPHKSADLQPDETPSEWIARLRRQQR